VVDDDVTLGEITRITSCLLEQCVRRNQPLYL